MILTLQKRIKIADNCKIVSIFALGSVTGKIVEKKPALFEM